MIQESWESLATPIANSTKKGNCSSCGQCCADYLPISLDEIIKIDEYLKTHKVRPTKSRLEIMLDGKAIFTPSCPFRNHRTKKCKIYQVRPSICSKYRCDKPTSQLSFDNSDKLVRSMRLIFFNDNTNQKYIEKEYAIKAYGREDVETRIESINRKINDLEVESHADYITRKINEIEAEDHTKYITKKIKELETETHYQYMTRQLKELNKVLEKYQF